MKIAQVTSLIESVPPLHNNGLEFIVHFLTEGLVDRGHEVTLFATGDSKTKAELASLWPKATSRDSKMAEPFANYFSQWNHEAAYLRSREFDIIHSHDLMGMFWAALSVPVVVTVHNPGWDYGWYKREYPREYWSCFEHYINRIRDGYLIFISEHQIKHFPRGEHHYVVHNGVPMEDFTFSGDTDDYFAFLGYLDENKAPHLAIRAAMQAGVKLKIAGGYYGQTGYYKGKIEPFLASGKVEYLGSLGYKDKIEFLQRARAIFIPIQWKEPFGLVMIEAMSCGTPVIALNRAAVPEIVVDGKTGFICNSVDEMAEAAKKINKINRLECRRHVRKNFSIERMVEGYERVYGEIISDFKRRFKK
ncbi:glycosyltransferase family 4 protein [Patescibacteria group bacterium]|nr:glycosyltransferase family 4 protein [Patescibacteria group bacterium]MBU1868364.1 glycosyltransferase family 4 protein [Patescibacteria group bacterium]